MRVGGVAYLKSPRKVPHPAVDVPLPPSIGHLGVNVHNVALCQGQLPRVSGAEVVAGHRRAHHPGREDWGGGRQTLPGMEEWKKGLKKGSLKYFLTDNNALFASAAVRRGCYRCNEGSASGERMN